MRRLLLIFLLFLPASPAVADVFDFVTPSGNIYCQVGLERDFSDIFCRIHERQGVPAAPALAGCANGHSFAMGDRGPVQVSCEAGGRWPGQSEAAYGDTGQFGGIICRSETSGLTCTNRDGHGFFLSRRSQRAF
ncbi:MAG: DUF6636 domain-containing protein [Pseudomonadota bacterium]